jgi:hypothetical protein
MFSAPWIIAATSFLDWSHAHSIVFLGMMKAPQVDPDKNADQSASFDLAITTVVPESDGKTQPEIDR